MGAQVFISHSSKDRKVAQTICSALESRKFKCWLASRDVGPGTDFMEEIVNAINDAKVMVLVFSENANNSDEIKREIVLAGNAKVPVIPVRVEDVAPKGAFAYQLATRQWIDLFEDWEHEIEVLAASIARNAKAGSSPGASEVKLDTASELQNRRADTPTVAVHHDLNEVEAPRRAEADVRREKDAAEARRIVEQRRQQEEEAGRLGHRAEVKQRVDKQQTGGTLIEKIVNWKPTVALRRTAGALLVLLGILQFLMLPALWGFDIRVTLEAPVNGVEVSNSAALNNVLSFTPLFGLIGIAVGIAILIGGQRWRIIGLFALGGSFLFDFVCLVETLDFAKLVAVIALAKLLTCSICIIALSGSLVRSKSAA